jgi:hypothetical protein
MKISKTIGMSAINKPMPGVRKTALIAASILVVYWIGLFLWRYTPVRVRPDSIRKIVPANLDNFKKWQCDLFVITPEYFSTYFASVHRLSTDEENEYDFGACYYEATIEGKKYRIWEAGIAEIIDGNTIARYANTAAKTNMNP